MKAILLTILLLSFAGCLWLVVFCGLRQDRKKSLYFMLAGLALSFYTLGYFVELLAKTPEAVMTAIKIEYVGVPIAVPLVLLMVISVFYPKALRKWMLPTVLGWGVLIWTCVLTNDQHHLYYNSLNFVQETGFAKLGHGPIYFAHQAVSLSCMLIANGIAIKRYFTGSERLKKRVRAMVSFSLGTLLIDIIYILGLMPGSIDIVPIVLSISLLMFTMVMMRHHQIDLVPIASTNAVRTMEDPVVVLDDQMSLQYWNLAAAKLFPALVNCIDGDSINSLGAWPQVLRDQAVPGEVTFCLPDEQGAAHYFRAKVSHVTDTGEAMIGWSYVIRDITEEIDMVQRLEEMATTDPLTGILNRRQFMRMVEHEMEVAARLKLKTALLMYDLDLFKRVNDTYGHSAGDHVLKSVVHVIKNQLRPYDIFARYGGEEFVVFTTSNENFDPEAFANRLRQHVEQAEINCDGHQIKVTASFGVACIKPNGNFEDAMRAADAALYKAKEAGRNCVVLAPEEV